MLCIFCSTTMYSYLYVFQLRKYREMKLVAFIKLVFLNTNLTSTTFFCRNFSSSPFLIQAEIALSTLCSVAWSTITTHFYINSRSTSNIWFEFIYVRRVGISNVISEARPLDWVKHLSHDSHENVFSLL